MSDEFSWKKFKKILGSTENVKKLIALGCKYDLEHTTKFGESAIFFALRQENWEFLRNFAPAYQKSIKQGNDFNTSKVK